jgi:hypothetical protein
MKKIFFSLFPVVLLFTVSLAQQSETAKGIVYHDMNNNGMHDAGEPGIAGVAISNGIEVKLTDQNGHYEIGAGNDAIIFVIKPGQYIYPVNENMLPKFYYIHKPDGSPDLKYPGVMPTGALPASVDFGLLTGAPEEDFSLVVMADPQTYTEKEVTYYETDIVGSISKRKDISFGITLGDIVGDDLSLFEPLNKATAKTGKPWFHVFGNHDMNFDAKIRSHSDETFERVYGPSTYAFNHGKVHFIVINNIIYPNTYTGSSYVGGIGEEQFRFMENSLKYVPMDNLVVLCMHIPLYDQIEYGETFLAAHRERLFNMLSDRQFTLSLSGHTHTLRHYYFSTEQGWKQENPHHHYTTGTASGDWWSGKFMENGVPETVMYDGTPNGYSIIHVKGNQYTIEYVPVKEPEKRLRIYGPNLVPQNKRYRGSFYVNFFQGSELDSVYYRINDGEWKKMRYTVEFDPYVCAVRYEWDHAEQFPYGIRPSNPVLSYHLWRTRISTSLPLGTNRFSVLVKDQFGFEYGDDYLFDVVDTE